MMFLKTKDLSLKNGGYLVTGKDVPVTHAQFVSSQRRAHYLVTLSKEVKKASFETKAPDSFISIVEKVAKSFVNQDYVYKELSEKPVRKITDSLKNEALEWLNFKGKKKASKKINRLMQEFNILKDFEEFGLYFSEGLVKLNAIYTIEEVLEAITTLEPHLD